jgi:hypothetical protein
MKKIKIAYEQRHVISLGKAKLVMNSKPGLSQQCF